MISFVINTAGNFYSTCTYRYFFSFFFCPPFLFVPSHLLSSPFFSLSLLVVTQIRGHIAGSSPPLPTTVRALHFYHEKISALSYLVDSRRIVLTHGRRSQQFGWSFFFLIFLLQINSTSRDSMTTVLIVGFQLQDQHN